MEVLLYLTVVFLAGIIVAPAASTLKRRPRY
jgi:hypothetical protein